jgi:hypothetical protein
LRAKEASLNTLVSDRKTVSDSLDTKDMSLDDDNLDAAAAKVVSLMFKKVESNLTIPEIVITEADEVKEVVDTPIKVEESQVTQVVPEAKIEIPVIECTKKVVVSTAEPAVEEEKIETPVSTAKAAEEVATKVIDEAVEMPTTRVESQLVAEVETAEAEEESKPKVDIETEVNQESNDTTVAMEEIAQQETEVLSTIDSPVDAPASSNDKKKKKKNKKKGKK